MDNSGGEGFLNGGVRVSEQSKVLGRESNRGDVVSGTERKSVQSGNSRTSDRRDVSNNRVVEKVSPNNRWESWGVMNMVGRVLGGKLYMDDEVEDVNDFENRRVGDMNAWQDVIGEPVSENPGKVNRVVDMNTWQDVTREATSEKGIDIKRMDIDFDSVKLDLGCPVEGNGLNGNLDSVSHEIAANGGLESDEINDIKADVLRLEGHGETEEVNDVKVDVWIPKGHGGKDLLTNEILPRVPMETEEVNDSKADTLALKSRGGETEKEGRYNVSDLVWGKVKSHPWWPGQIFALSDASDKAKKYSKKESYLVAYFGDESFAWNEGSKLMPFREHFSEMVKQSNADGFSHAVSCALDEAARRVEFDLSCPCLAQEVRDEIKFQIVENSGIREESSIRSGGDNVSSTATFHAGDALQFLESLAKCPQSEPDKLQFTTTKAQLLAYTRWKGHNQLPVFEEHTCSFEDETQRNLSDTMEVIDGVLPYPVPDAANSVPSKKRKKEKFMSVLMSSDCSTLHKNDEKFVKSSKKVVSKSKRRKTEPSNDVKLASIGGGKPQIVKTLPTKMPSPDMLLSKLSLAAKKSTQGHKGMTSVVGWLHEFRKSVCLEKSSLASQELDSAEPSLTADISGFGGTEDSYWTDRIIQGYSQDPASFRSQKPCENGAKLDDSKKSNDTVALVPEEYQPTALILKFSNLDSVPSIKNLNEIFSRYGALDESKTKILTRTKRISMTFKRAKDAETAFSSAGKYSIFGPSLLSYRLRYGSEETSKKKKKSKQKQNKEGPSQKGDGV